MQQYQFEKIYSLMEREFGKIKSGQEEAHALMLMPIESNALRIHRMYPTSNSRRLREAIALALFDIKERYSGDKINLDSFRDDDNARLEEAVLMAFDPFTNEEVKEIISSQSTLDITNKTMLHDYYAEPIRCLLRIKDSIDTWEKQMGSNGYFDYIEQFMGAEIKGNEMKFSILASVQ
jgi:hypothetical protein